MRNKTFVLQFLGYEFRVTSYQILIILGIFIGYFLTRLINLTQLPVFCDEAIYIRWSQIMRREPGLRFISLQDGKQPLFMWLTIPFLKIFKDPLFAGRLVSVFAGFATLIGVISLPAILSYLKIRKSEYSKILNRDSLTSDGNDPRKLSHESVNLGLLAGLVYVFIPFSLFFDRMALVDSLLTAFGIWSLNLSLLLARTKRLDIAMILGMVLGGGLITKSPGMFFVGLSVLTVILLNLKFKIINLKLIFLLLVSLGISFLIYNILRLGPEFHMLSIRNRDYVRDFGQIISSPFQPAINILGDSLRYYWYYFTPGLFLIGLIGILTRIKQFKNLEVLILGLWLLAPLTAQSLIAQEINARYILFTVPIFILFVCYGLRVASLRIIKLTRNSRTGNAITLLTFFFPAFIFNYHLWFSPAKANLPADERAGYLEDWTSGWGLSRTADYLKEMPEDESIVVGTEGFFGTMPDGLQIYLADKENITVIGSSFPVKSVPQSLIESADAGNKTYLVVNQSRYKIEESDAERLELIQAYDKPGEDKLLFFEVN